MAEWLRYSDSVDRVLQALGELRFRGACPTLLCVPDILVLRHEHSPPAPASRSRGKKKPADQDWAERETQARSLYFLDGHACISALTAAYLSSSLASEYSVLLAVKAGNTGKVLLNDEQWEFKRRGSQIFHSLLMGGIDREIKTRDTGNKVGRKIDDAEEGNQLSWADLDSLNCLPWLDSGNYGLLIGDVQSYLVTRDPTHRMPALVKKAAITVIDTLAWRDREDQNRGIWETVRSLSVDDALTFVSVSDSDINDLAAAAGLVIDEAASAETVGKGLATTLKSGYLVLHAKDINVIFSCPDGTARTKVPVCEIDVKSSNGAGDTFNGALALAAVALLYEKSPGAAVSAGILRDILTFATVVVSLRLKNGKYATRGELLIESQQLLAKGNTGLPARSPRNGFTYDFAEAAADRTRRSQLLAQVLTPFWNQIPKLALIDLDHTLCDSEKWRRTSALAAFRALGISGEIEELENLYGQIYEDHELWEKVIHVNVRYRWNSKQLYELALALDALLKTTTYEMLRENTELVKVELNRIRSDSDRPGRYDRRIEDAEKGFENSPAFGYPDSIAGLYQLRDVLGFKLLIVTEGDLDTQCWKLDTLGLGHMFHRYNDTIYTEEAFASIDRVKQVFSNAIAEATIELNSDNLNRLTKAFELCRDLQQYLKTFWRAAALRKIVKRSVDESRGTSKGVFICTFGDRIDTDVVPYLEIRRQQLTGGSYGGLLTGRLKRGYYKDLEQPGYSPDIAVNSLPEFVADLAQPGFWDQEPVIPAIKKLRHKKPKSEDYMLLKSVRNIDPDVATLIDTILEYFEWDDLEN